MARPEQIGHARSHLSFVYRLRLAVRCQGGSEGVRVVRRRWHGKRNRAPCRQREGALTSRLDDPHIGGLAEAEGERVAYTMSATSSADAPGCHVVRKRRGAPGGSTQSTHTRSALATLAPPRAAEGGAGWGEAARVKPVQEGRCETVRDGLEGVMCTVEAPGTGARIDAS